jgi:hypothetical protein
VSEIILPARNWQPRPYQRQLWRYLEGGGKRAVAAMGKSQSTLRALSARLRMHDALRALDALPAAPAQALGEMVEREVEAYRSNGGSVAMVFQGSIDHYHAERHWTHIGTTLLLIRATEGGGE